MTPAALACTGIIANMIELHKVEAGELTLNVQTFSIRAVLRDVLLACGMGGHGEGGVSWVNEDDVELPALVQARMRCWRVRMVQLSDALAWLCRATRVGSARLCRI